MPRFRMLAALGALTALIGLDLARAGCAAPTLSIEQRSVVPGERITIVGTSWGDACNDTSAPGCGSPPPLGDPVTDIELQLRAIGSRALFPLATVDAGDDYRFSVRVEVPDVPAGRYEVTDSDGRSVFEGGPIRVEGTDEARCLLCFRPRRAGPGETVEVTWRPPKDHTWGIEGQLKRLRQSRSRLIAHLVGHVDEPTLETAWPRKNLGFISIGFNGHKTWDWTVPERLRPGSYAFIKTAISDEIGSIDERTLTARARFVVVDRDD